MSLCTRTLIEKRLTIVNLSSINVLVQRLMNYYPNYSTRRLYFETVEIPYYTSFNKGRSCECKKRLMKKSQDIFLKRYF